MKRAALWAALSTILSIMIVFLLARLYPAQPLTSCATGSSLHFTISKSDYKTENGEIGSVIVEMVQGKSYTSQETYPGGGIFENNYEGKYRMELIKPLSTQENKQFVYSNLEKDFDSDSMNFGGCFQLRFADYNGDGNIDFTLGQWGGSNGTFYNLYSIIDGKIIKLDTQGMLYASGHEPSILFQKNKEKEFSLQYYDQKSGMKKEKVYIWSKNRFITSD